MKKLLLAVTVSTLMLSACGDHSPKEEFDPGVVVPDSMKTKPGPAVVVAPSLMPQQNITAVQPVLKDAPQQPATGKTKIIIPANNVQLQKNFVPPVISSSLTMPVINATVATASNKQAHDTTHAKKATSGNAAVPDSNNHQ